MHIHNVVFAESVWRHQLGHNIPVERLPRSRTGRRGPMSCQTPRAGSFLPPAACHCLTVTRSQSLLRGFPLPLNIL